MRGLTPLAALAAGLVASASAGSIHAHHQNLHGRRQAAWNTPDPSASESCGCTTYWTTWYGEPTLVQDQPSSTASAQSTSTSSSSTSTSTSTPPPAPTTSSSSVWAAANYAAPSSASAPASSAAVSSSAAPSSSSSGSSGSVSSNGNQWAMTYTPYSSDGSCKSAGAVSSDIASIKAKGFSTVRIYATDCSGPQNVGSACKANGLKLILGIYIDNSGIGSKTDEQVSALTQWGQGQWDLVEMVVAGNEAIFNNYASASQLASFVSSVKSKFQAAGYNGPVTTTEPLGTIQANANTLCPAVDVIAANIHPFFNPDVSASDAGGFVSSQLADLAKACNNQKEAYNLETGWPSNGEANGAAVPGQQNQKTAVEGIISSAGSKSAIFSFQNDNWKASGPLNVEQHFGCADLFSG